MYFGARSLVVPSVMSPSIATASSPPAWIKSLQILLHLSAELEFRCPVIYHRSLLDFHLVLLRCALSMHTNRCVPITKPVRESGNAAKLSLSYDTAFRYYQAPVPTMLRDYSCRTVMWYHCGHEENIDAGGYNSTLARFDHHLTCSSTSPRLCLGRYAKR
jgi:hypothetical protein